MDENFKKSFERAAALQNLWVDSMTGIAQSWSDYAPTEPPPEEMKKARQRMLAALSKSWEDFMRTPQFMEMMRDSMKGAGMWSKEAKAGASRMQEAVGVAGKEDIEGVLLAIRHVEKRVLDRLETLQETIDALQDDFSTIANGHSDSINEAFQKEILSRLSDLEKQLAKRSAPAGRSTPTEAKPAAKPAAAKPKPNAAKKTAARKTARRK